MDIINSPNQHQNLFIVDLMLKKKTQILTKKSEKKNKLRLSKNKRNTNKMKTFAKICFSERQYQKAMTKYYAQQWILWKNNGVKPLRHLVKVLLLKPVKAY